MLHYKHTRQGVPTDAILVQLLRVQHAAFQVDLEPIVQVGTLVWYQSQAKGRDFLGTSGKATVVVLLNERDVPAHLLSNYLC